MIDLKHPLAVLACRMALDQIESVLASIFVCKHREGCAIPGDDLVATMRAIAGRQHRGRPTLVHRHRGFPAVPQTFCFARREPWRAGGGELACAAERMTAYRSASADSCGASRPSRRCALVVGVVLVGVLMALEADFFLDLGRWVVAGSAALARGDVIVALGGDDGHRVSNVALLFAAGDASAVLVTGLESSPNRERSYYVNWRVQVLGDAGVPPKRLPLKKTATNSFREAAATLALMRAGDWQTALMVSDPPRMRRLDWGWGQAFAGSGKTYVLVASEPAWWDANQ